MEQTHTSRTALEQSIATVQDRLSRQYLQRFSSGAYDVRPIADGDITQIRTLKLTRLAYNGSERIAERLNSVYRAVLPLADTCFMIVQSRRGQDTELYLGIRSSASAAAAAEALRSSLQGNFPGIEVELLDSAQQRTLTHSIPVEDPRYPIPCVSLAAAVPAGRAQQDRTDEQNVQGLEKFIDAMQGKEYTAVLLARPYAMQDIADRIASLEAISTALSAMESQSVTLSGSRSAALSDSAAASISDTINESLTQGYSSAYTNSNFQQYGTSQGKSFNPFLFGFSSGAQSGYGSSNGTTRGTSENIQRGTSAQSSLSRSAGLVLTSTEGESLMRTSRNVSISNLLQQLSRQIERLREGQAYGLWDACAYFIAPSADIAVTASSQFISLVTGDGSNIERSVCTLWQPERYSDGTKNESIRNLVLNLLHGLAPRFAPRDGTGISHNTDCAVTGKELPRLLSLPKYSAGNVTVLHMAAFGRRIHRLDGAGRDPDPLKEIPLGRVRHMGADQPEPVYLQTDRLASHTAVFGATGSGKSTAVCNILESLHERQIPFTVIEPAKGDYSSIWQNLPGIQLFSSSPFRCRMLRINPFAFEDSTHILTHIERLIDVFRVCWPLYAAQPAVLRSCVDRAYIACGWDLTNSLWLGSGPVRFPTFCDVLAALPSVIRQSKFVGEAKGTYEGALQTRLSMLTEGLFGQLLNSGQDIPAEELFDRNAIIDLSEIGSPEVSSLLMGVLVIRLYEHRMASGASRLRHVTVLEEAHNILPRAPASLDPEGGGSSAGKAVDVLSRCLAELRFTGEGFMIIDQSPNAVDDSAIKNTASKIVMHLNAQDDQRAAGAALSLTDAQANELARLPQGVAVVYQDGWAEPVLAHLEACHRWAGSRDRKICPADMQRIRGFLVQHILHQAEKKAYSPAALDAAVGNIHGLDPWKKQDYQALFAFYEKQHARLGASFALAAEHAPFFGSLLRDVLGCDGLFQAFPVPAPDRRTMQPPYAKDAAYIGRCRRWQTQLLRILKRYCGDLPEEKLAKLLQLLLFAEAGRDPLCFLTIGALFPRSEEKGV